MIVPYIGITGVMNRAQSVAISASALNLMYNSGRQIMIGVLVSSKTLNGEGNKYPHLYPSIKILPDIFLSDPRFLNLIHYNTDNPLLLRDELFKIIRLFRERKNGLNGFQLNVPWPSISHLEDVKNAFPKLKIVLQIGPQAFERTNHSPEKMLEMAYDYVSFVDYFLLDANAGFGKPLDAQFLLPYLHELSNYFSVGLAVAGGLSSDALHLAEPLIKEFPDLSIDAQSGLQTNKTLDIEKCRDYIVNSRKIFQKYE